MLSGPIRIGLPDVICVDAESSGGGEIVDAPPAYLQKDKGKEQYAAGLRPFFGRRFAEMEI